MRLADCFVSVLVPLQNHEDVVGDFVSEVSAVLSAHYEHYEIVLIDDGSVDRTVELLSKTMVHTPCIRLIALSRSFGEEIAVSAGLEAVIGDYVVTMRAITDPPAMIPQLVERVRVGGRTMQGVLANSEVSLFTRWLGSVFHAYLRRFVSLNIPRHATLFSAMSRQSVNAITEIKTRLRNWRALSAYVGFGVETFEYTSKNRRPKHRNQRGTYERIRAGINLIVANSSHPLRLVSAVSIAASCLSLAYIFYVFATFLISKQLAEGWVTQSVQSSSMFFFNFLVLAIVCEYVGRILNEVQERPLYYVSKELNSFQILPDELRRNISVFTSSVSGSPVAKRDEGIQSEGRD